MAAEIAPAEHRAQKIQYQCCKRYPNSPQLYTETVIFEQKAFQLRPAGMPYHAGSDAPRCRLSPPCPPLPAPTIPSPSHPSSLAMTNAATAAVLFAYWKCTRRTWRPMKTRCGHGSSARRPPPPRPPPNGRGNPASVLKSSPTHRLAPCCAQRWPACAGPPRALPRPACRSPDGAPAR